MTNLLSLVSNGVMTSIEQEYGVFLLEGSLNDLMAFPPTKKHSYNDWPEMNGLEYDLSAHYLDSSEITLRFASTGDGLDTFIAALGDSNDTTGASTYRTFYFHLLNLEIQLRFVSESNRSTVGGITTTTLKLSHDSTPLNGYNYAIPTGAVARQYGLLLDDVDVSTYGLQPLEGTSGIIKVSGTVKANQQCKSNYRDGLVYDSGMLRKKERAVSIPFVMRATSIGNLRDNWKALLYDLTRTGARTLEYDSTQYLCFYSSSSVQEFYPQHSWLKLTITFTYING
jgi:hypothetical protein